MGRANRERRRAKAKDRGRPQPTARGERQDPGRRAGPGAREQAELTVLEAMSALTRDDGDAVLVHAARLADRSQDAGWPETAGRVIFTLLTGMITQLWRSGWQPADLVRMARRERGDRHARLAGDLIVAELRAYSAVTVDERWDAQLAALDTKVWWDRDDTYPWAVAERDGVDRIIVTAELLELLHVLRRLPALQLLGPVPGQARRSTPTSAGRARAEGAVADERLLRRLRAMLAKAESTDFPEEAEALTARAQELMARHSIDRALLAATDPAAKETPYGRRIGIDNPYESPKAVLLTVVAEANRCRSIWSRELGFCTVLGFPSDLDAVELLFTSLLVQATTAMVGAGSKTDQRGRSRTRSFRQSFLAAYASRIGERLQQATDEATRQAVAESPGTDLVPVLAARDQAVGQAVEDLFPKVVSHRMRGGSDQEGWISGRAAADLASLHGAAPVERSYSGRTAGS